MKEKFDFLYQSITAAINNLNQKKITVDHAKALAALAKQANNTIATQLDASKFLANVKEARELLQETGLTDSEDAG